MPALNFLSAFSMAEQIRAKKLSPVELVDAHLTQIECLNPKLNAFVQVDVRGCTPPGACRRSRGDAR